MNALNRLVCCLLLTVLCAAGHAAPAADDVAVLTAAAEGGDPAAQYALGVHHTQAAGGQVDAQAAARWFAAGTPMPS